MNNYKESKAKLDKIRQEYNCKGDIIFTTAMQMVVEHGTENFNDDEWFNEVINGIDKRHDKAEAEGKWLWMTRDFEKAIVNCAHDAAKIRPYDLMLYIQREMYLSSGVMGEPDYQRAIEIIKRCMQWMDEEISKMGGTLDAFYDIGFTDDEIANFGYEYLFDYEEDEE